MSTSEYESARTEPRTPDETLAPATTDDVLAEHLDTLAGVIVAGEPIDDEDAEILRDAAKRLRELARDVEALRDWEARQGAALDMAVGQRDRLMAARAAQPTEGTDA